MYQTKSFVFFENAQKEIDLVSQKADKQQILDKYCAVLDHEQSKLNKAKAVLTDTSDEEVGLDESSDDESIHVVEVRKPDKQPKVAKTAPLKLGTKIPKTRVSTLNVDSASTKPKSLKKTPPAKPTRPSIGKLPMPKPKSKAKVQLHAGKGDLYLFLRLVPIGVQ